MLGELIAESRGKRTGRRVLPSEGGGIKVEASVEAAGKTLGYDAHVILTYQAGIRADGTLFGSGRGIGLSKEGDVVTWVGHGVAKLGEGGAVSYRGAVCFRTASPKFARLNSIAGVFEFEIDAKGNTHSKIWEWK
jgi:hypothetical protein